MFLRILKKDLKRRRTTNIILVLFVILATMFVSSGLNNVITVINGTDYYFEQAGVGDYIIISRDQERDNLDDFLANTDAINSYTLENFVYAGNESVYDADGNILKNKNMVLLQAYDQTGMKYFDSNNVEPELLSEGHCYATGSFLEKNDINMGDKITIKAGFTEMEFIIDGVVKDALLGSDFMGNSRFLLNSDDYKKFEEDELNSAYAFGQICNVFTDDVQAVDAAASNCENLMFSDGKSTIKLAYVMDMIVAFVVLILSLCLMIVSFVVLKFAINLTITEAFREIGVMKAIGIKNRKIRSIYIVKYLVIAVVGSVIGFVLSFPFGALLLDSVSKTMVLGNSYGVMPNIIGGFIVVLSIVGFAYLSTRKVNKATPVDAIRSGQTGERYKRKSVLRLRKSRGSVPSFMARNDILSSPRRYITIIIAFALCTLFVLVLVNTVTTMKSDRLVDTFASKSDLYINFTSDQMNEIVYSFKTEEDWENYLNEQKEFFAQKGIPGEFFMDFQYKCQMTTVDGNDFSMTCQQGLGTKMEDYTFYEGSAPSSPDEIAITPQVAEKFGINIGDTVTIDYGFETRDVTVSALFQTMNNLGQIVRIHEDAATDMSKWSGVWPIQVKFTDNPSDEEILERQEVFREYFSDAMTATEYQIDCLAVVPTMEAVQYLLLAITLVVVVFVTILMETSFISDEKSQIAILKAIGFKNSRIISWHVIRFGIVALIAAIIAAVLSIPMTELCITPIFGMMGMQTVDYAIKPLRIFVIYPLIIVAVTVVIAFITALKTRSIKSSDTANIE